MERVSYREELGSDTESVGGRKSLDNRNTLLLESLGLLAEDNLGSVREESLKTLNRQVLLVDLASKQVREDLLLGLTRINATKN